MNPFDFQKYLKPLLKSKLFLTSCFPLPTASKKGLVPFLIHSQQ